MKNLIITFALIRTVISTLPYNISISPLLQALSVSDGEIFKLRVNDKFLVTMNWYEGAQVFPLQADGTLAPMAADCSDVDFGDVELFTTDNSTFMYVSVGWTDDYITAVYNLSQIFDPSESTNVCNSLQLLPNNGASSIFLDYDHYSIYLLGSVSPQNPVWDRYDIRDPSKLISMPFTYVNSSFDGYSFYNEGHYVFVTFNGIVYGGDKYGSLNLVKFIMTNDSLNIENIEGPYSCNEITIYKDNILCLSSYENYASWVYNVTSANVVASTSYPAISIAGITRIGYFGCYGAYDKINCYDLSLSVPSVFTLESNAGFSPIQSLAFYDGYLYVTTGNSIQVYYLYNWNNLCDSFSPCSNIHNDYPKNPLRLSNLNIVWLSSPSDSKNLTSQYLQVVDDGINPTRYPITYSVSSLSSGVLIEKCDETGQYEPTSSFSDDDIQNNRIKISGVNEGIYSILIDATNDWGGSVIGINLQVNVSHSSVESYSTVSNIENNTTETPTLQYSVHSQYSKAVSNGAITTVTQTSSQYRTIYDTSFPSVNVEDYIIIISVFVFITMFILAVLIYRRCCIRKDKRSFNSSVVSASTNYFSSSANTATKTTNIGSTVTSGSTILNGTTMMSFTREIALPAFLELDPTVTYRGCHMIAEGGMGEVHIAETIDSKLCMEHPKLIVKISKRSSSEHISAMHQEVSIMWFLRDCKYTAKLVGYSSSPLSIIMKYYEFGSLQDWLAKFQRQKRMMFYFLSDISGGIYEMHSRGLVHCDLKPQNILIDFDVKLQRYFCVLTDFGIAKVVQSEHLLVEAFKPINIKGLSLAYASPELIRSLRLHGLLNEFAYRSNDVYAFSIIAYQAINGLELYEASQ